VQTITLHITQYKQLNHTAIALKHSVKQKRNQNKAQNYESRILRHERLLPQHYAIEHWTKCFQGKTQRRRTAKSISLAYFYAKIIFLHRIHS